MSDFKLNVQSPNNGCYLSSEQIDMLNIINCENIEELFEFLKNCVQLQNLNIEEELYEKSLLDFDMAKKILFSKYQETFVKHDSDEKTVLNNLISRLNITDVDKETLKTILINPTPENIKNVFLYLRENYSEEEYDSICNFINNFVSRERDQCKDENLFEEFSFLSKELSTFDTILIASGKATTIINQTPNNEPYNFYFLERDLDFALKNNKKVRLHSLLTKGVCFEHFIGKSKEEVSNILKEYVKTMIDLVNSYNKDYGQVITSIDVFNELISFQKNDKGEYENIWEKTYGINIDELCEIFRYAFENKPQGVSYVYNECFLEDCEKRKKVIETLNAINERTNNGIDTLGTQMHLNFSVPIQDIEDSFADFYKLQQEKGINIKITEFDVSMNIEQLSIIKDQGYTDEEVNYHKKEKVDSISNAIFNSNVIVDEITYWSLTDSIDFNLERMMTQGATDITTAYGGLYPRSTIYQKIQQEEKTSENKIK